MSHQRVWPQRVAQSVAHPTPGRAGPRSHSAAKRKWSLHPMGGPCAAAQCFHHASNAQATATRRPGTDCDEPTRGAPDRCVKQGVAHSAVPPRRKRADGPLGERGRRPRTHCRPAPSAAAVTLAHEREPPEIVPGRQHGGRATSRDCGLERIANRARRRGTRVSHLHPPLMGTATRSHASLSRYVVAGHRRS
jgi:hypothetical protein